MADNGRLTRAEARFVAALVASPTVSQAAALAQVSERSAYRFLARPEVRAELAQRSGAVLSQVSVRLADAMGSAVEGLLELASDAQASASARVSAYRALLEGGLKLAEIVALSDRLAVVEARLDEQQAMQGAAEGASYRIGGLKAGDV